VGVMGQNIFVLPRPNEKSMWGSWDPKLAPKFAYKLLWKCLVHLWCQCGTPWPVPFHLHWVLQYWMNGSPKSSLGPHP
jgi:hypothetical protein